MAEKVIVVDWQEAVNHEVVIVCYNLAKFQERCRQECKKSL